jgi:hypothetical protein
MSAFEERLVDMIAKIVSLNSQKRELDQLRDRVKKAELSVRKSTPKFRRESERPELNLEAPLFEDPSRASGHCRTPPITS